MRPTRRLYEQVAAAHIDVVSVGTRAGLLALHDVLLELRGNGEWRISRPDSSRLRAGVIRSDGKAMVGCP